MSLLKVYTIECRTGCSCCWSENHSRGFYETREDAQRRIDYFLSPESKYWPLASQYARRGNYHIHEHDAEEIDGERIIVEDFIFNLEFVRVNKDGTVFDNESERLSQEI